MACLKAGSTACSAFATLRGVSSRRAAETTCSDSAAIRSRSPRSSEGEAVMKTIERPMPSHKVVTREEWLKARTALLVKEKELTRLRDQLSAERRALPWVKIDKDYVFDAPEGKVTLADLFDG